MKLDIYFNITQNVTISAVGGEVHLSGFFEPQKEELDDDMFLDDEEEEEEEEGVATNGKLNASLKQAKANALKNAKGAFGDEDEDDDDDEEEEEDYDEEDEDEDSEEEKPKAKSAQQQ